MNDASRRGFLAMAGTGAAVAGVAALTPSALAAGKTAAPQGVDLEGPVVAFVKDAAKGEVAIMHGEREVVVVDRDLVARLTSTIGKKG